VADLGWALAGVLAVLIALNVPIAAFLLYASSRRPELHAAATLRRRSLADMTVGTLGLAYVPIVILNGGFVFLIGAIASVTLVLISLSGLRLAAARAAGT
jgi:hypothetical protein